jgi:glucose-6-phosphate dehydrogenase assembly protein OpcA
VTASVGAVVTSVEARLREMWVDTPGEPTKARACTMNLIVVGAPDVMERYQSIVEEVTSSIPARAILLALDPEGPADLTADVSAVCGVGADATCSERIALHVGGALCARAASIVDALRVPEMQAAVVWLGRVHVDDPVFVGLATDATRLVLDTEYTSVTSLLSLSRWVRGRSRARRDSGRPPGHSVVPGVSGEIDTPYIADLAWTRLAPWQEMIARLFDDPRLVEHAGHIRKIELRQACESGTRLGSETTLLLGWLGTRLDWKMSRIGGRLRIAGANGNPIQLHFAASERPAGIAPSALTGIAIEAEHDGVPLRGCVERDLASEADVLVWRLAAGDVPSANEHRVRLGANRGGRLLERTLHRAPYDAALMESAKFAEDVSEEGIVCL